VRACFLSGINDEHPVPGSLNKKEGRRCNLLLNKRWNLLPSFLSNEPGTVGPNIVESNVNMFLVEKVKGRKGDITATPPLSMQCEFANFSG
jgi:hypothetical protein